MIPFGIEETVWERLARQKRPVVLYGMGNGADKIRAVFEAYSIPLAAVFASDEFVRGHSYAGYQVERLSDITARLGEDITIVISFASQRPEVLQLMYALDEKYDVVAPDVPVAGEGLFDLAFAKEHAEALKRAYALLADEISRRVFENTIAFKLTGQLSCLKEITTDKDEVFLNILRPQADEHFLDLGAYNGDTIRELLSYTNGKFASLTALEPDRKNFKKLVKYAQEMLGGQVSAIQAGAWHEDTVLRFAAKAGRNSALSNAGNETVMRAADSVLAGAPCTMLKMDVEGAEHSALLGARETIAAYRPKLNIAAYHRNEDLFDLPLLVHELCPAYRLYLRHHPYVPAWDTNLYAVSE